MIIGNYTTSPLLRNSPDDERCFSCYDTLSGDDVEEDYAIVG
jgi:hypothetical protein